MTAVFMLGCGGGAQMAGTGGAAATGGADMPGAGGAIASGGAPAIGTGGSATGGAATGGASSGGQGTGGQGTGGQTGTGGAPAPISTNWTVQIQAPTWTCFGQMAMTVTAGNGTGTWNCAETPSGCATRQLYVAAGPCINFTGPAKAQFFTDNSVTMQLFTDVTHGIAVTGTLGTDRVIGTAMFADGSFPFTAILR